MTCIAVKIKGKVIEIAGDTQASWGKNKMPWGVQQDKQTKVNGKLFEVNGMHFGCAGSVSDIGLLQIFCKTHRPKEMNRDDIMEWFIEFKEWLNDKAKVSFNDVNIHGIIASEGKVFTFYDFMEVSEVTDFNAVGSGMWLALGAMENGASVSQAVATAIKYDLNCGGDVTMKIIK